MRLPPPVGVWDKEQQKVYARTFDWDAAEAAKAEK